MNCLPTKTALQSRRVEGQDFVSWWTEVTKKCSLEGMTFFGMVFIPLGPCKMRCDAAVFVESNKLGLGCIIRDDSGRFIAAAKHNSMRVRLIPSIAEALSCREGLSWLKSLLGQHNVIVDSDSQVLIHAINNSRSDLSEFGLVVDDCISIAKDIVSEPSSSFPCKSCWFVIWSCLSEQCSSFLLDVLAFDSNQ
ncbi:conserved hypothetical protein [Ricinus communis]|uniref:RNase H type-1 domain-containing protein n=1 Tax=Ricinus communis TaxID=3988 RepID=B9R9L7_RICCO|nr:conserved hypothetical protein [Ricinus communis]